MRENNQYIEQISERDIDLLLLEEMHSSQDFVSWIANRLAIQGPVTFDGAWHSLVDTRYGETDLLLRISTPGGRYGIHIENKIAAPEMPEQDTRYLARGQLGLESKFYDQFLTCMVAPGKYLDGLAHDSAYHAKLTYEDIRDWFALQPDARSKWRAYLLSEAISQSRRGYVVRPDASITDFQLTYWKHVCANYPKLIMKRPAEKGSKSTWLFLKTRSMKPGVTIMHKTEFSVVDLSYSNFEADRLAVLMTDRDSDISVVQTGKSAVARLQVEPADMFKPFSEQIASIDGALAAALRFADLYERTKVP